MVMRGMTGLAQHDEILQIVILLTPVGIRPVVDV
jgi:hypothetical protein